MNNIKGFSTDTNLRKLCTVDTIFVDGTFKSCPALFYQIFTIHAIINDNYIPLAFFLLSNKTTSSYQQAFQHVVLSCKNRGLSFQPECVYADFENAIQLAVNLVWPKSKVKGCRFHLGQSWYRKIQELGLSSSYRTNCEIGDFLKLFFGIPFLSPDSVEDFFVNDIMAIQPNDERVRKFTDYIFETYIVEADFPPNIWAEYSSSLIRTTNACESFHKKLNNLFGAPHPNIFHFIEVLKHIQSDSYIFFRSKGKRDKKTIEKETFIFQQMLALEKKDITTFNYVKKLAFKFLPHNI